MVQHGHEMPDPKPLESLDEWEDHLVDRYPDPASAPKGFKAIDPEKTKEQFRNYEADARPTVREFYRLNHTYQTLEFARNKRADFTQRNRREMTIWEALEFLNTLVDDSDPDTDLSQMDHLLQTSEHIRQDGHPRWFVMTGLIHDLGKILCLFDEPQWAVVGDTFPLGCRFSEKIVFPKFFEANPDSQKPDLQTENGIYEPGCGLDNVTMSWGHDEYLYHVVKDSNLPDAALYMIRYHSFYPWHREEAYTHLTNEKDRENLEWVRKFNPYDLYTKSHQPPDFKQLKPYYDDLIAEFLPGKIRF
ncbi:MAG: inositol oxygenase [Verrucomicrobia bacterium]|nr:inositol oxygenase [Verrucomicrobiota bacterium]